MDFFGGENGLHGAPLTCLTPTTVVRYVAVRRFPPLPQPVGDVVEVKLARDDRNVIL